MNNLTDEQMDKIIKSKLQKDNIISDKVNSVFENFNPDIYSKEVKVNENTKVNNVKFYSQFNKILSIAAVSLTVVLIGGSVLYFDKNFSGNSQNPQQESVVYTQKFVIKNEPLQFVNEEVIKEIENHFVKVFIIGNKDIAIQLKTNYWNRYDSEFSSDFSYKIENIDGEVADAFIGYTEGSGALPYIFILMKNGTGKYVDLNCLNKNEFLFIAKNIDGLDNIVGFEQCEKNYSYSTDKYEYVNAIRKDGLKKEIEIGKVNSWNDGSKNTENFNKLNEKYIKANNKESILDSGKGDYTVNGITYWHINGEDKYAYYIKNSKLYRVERSTAKEECIAEGVGGMIRDNMDGRMSISLCENYVIYSLDKNIIYKDRNDNVITEITKGNDEDVIIDGTGISTIYYENDYLKIKVLDEWKNRYEVLESNLSNKKEDIYTFRIIQKGKKVDVFTIMISGNESYKDSSWEYIGDNSDGRYVYYMKKFVCRDIDSNKYDKEDYKLEKEIDNVKISIKYELKNEFGNADKAKVLYGKYFMKGTTATNNKSYVYYINDNNQLCKTQLNDDFNTEILASDVQILIYFGSDKKIHAYPMGDSFMNNIAQLDDYIVFENIN